LAQYYMFHKPQGCVTAKTDARHKTVMDHFPETLSKALHPIGRLDKDTEGLLLITDDGMLNRRLTRPEFHVEKQYLFWAIGAPASDQIRTVENGIVLTGEAEPTKPCRISILGRDTMENITQFLSEQHRENLLKNPAQQVTSGCIWLTEGKTHQVRRLMRAAGCCVVYLKRLAIGRLKLDETLKPGEFRELTQEELDLLTDINTAT
jgi:16S rRNA pseudouridine516 synthase